MIDLNKMYIQSFLKNSFQHLDMDENPIILDIGCGSQPYLEILRNNSAFVVNSDIQRRFKNLDCCADAHNQPFAAHSFDLLLMSEVLEHLSNPKTAITEAARILKPGGHLILTWPFLYGIHDIPFDFCRFTEFGISQLLSSDFHVLSFQRRGDVFAVLHTIVAQLLLGIIEFFHRIPWFHYLFDPFFWLLKAIIEMTLKADFYFFRKTKRLNPDSLGQNLKGTVGTLALWSLGYCLIAQRHTV